MCAIAKSSLSIAQD